jgi:hypothetical protein
MYGGLSADRVGAGMPLSAARPVSEPRLFSSWLSIIFVSMAVTICGSLGSASSAENPDISSRRAADAVCYRSDAATVL